MPASSVRRGWRRARAADPPRDPGLLAEHHTARGGAPRSSTRPWPDPQGGPRRELWGRIRRTRSRSPLAVTIRCGWNRVCPVPGPANSSCPVGGPCEVRPPSSERRFSGNSGAAITIIRPDTQRNAVLRDAGGGRGFRKPCIPTIPSATVTGAQNELPPSAKSIVRILQADGPVIHTMHTPCAFTNTSGLKHRPCRSGPGLECPRPFHKYPSVERAKHSMLPMSAARLDAAAERTALIEIRGDRVAALGRPLQHHGRKRPMDAAILGTIHNE